MSILDLVRDDLRTFTGYLSARKQNGAGDIWLNANESAEQQLFDNHHLNRYPDPQPPALKTAICDYYNIDAAQCLVTRGSDEAIDLLIRALCKPGADRIAIQSPTFGMYAVCARLHGCGIIDSPLRQHQSGFEWDIAAMIASVLDNDCKLLFLCSPANPTGQSLAPESLEILLRALQGRCLVVVDEAYGDYGTSASALALLARYSNLAVLKTLSKAHALAGARIGLVAAAPELTSILKACQAPYPISKPSAEVAIQAFDPANRQHTHSVVQLCLGERRRVAEALQSIPVVLKVFDSDANFILVKFSQTDAVHRYLLERGIVVRAMSQYPAISDCLRISIGTVPENNALLNALAQYNVKSHA